jgi:hypothetical protein
MDADNPLEHKRAEYLGMLNKLQPIEAQIVEVERDIQDQHAALSGNEAVAILYSRREKLLRASDDINRKADLLRNDLFALEKNQAVEDLAVLNAQYEELVIHFCQALELAWKDARAIEDIYHRARSLSRKYDLACNARYGSFDVRGSSAQSTIARMLEKVEELTPEYFRRAKGIPYRVRRGLAADC